jgi:hypothetical protein
VTDAATIATDDRAIDHDVRFHPDVVTIAARHRRRSASAS